MVVALSRDMLRYVSIVAALAWLALPGTAAGQTAAPAD
jgi:hypothetical protein